MERNLLNNPKRVVISVYPDDSYLKTQQGYLVTQANAALKEDADLEKETQTFLSYENTPTVPKRMPVFLDYPFVICR